MNPTQLNIHHYASAAASHAHADHSQLVFGLHGSLELEIEGRGALVDSAAVVIIAPGDDHTFLSRDNGRCLVLDIPPQQALVGLELTAGTQERLLESTQLRSLTPQQMGLVGSLANTISIQPGLAEAGASLLLASLLHHPAETSRLPMAALDAYIDAHLAYPIEISDLAKLAHTSNSRLRHWFALELSCSPGEYVRRRRLCFARQQLEQNRDPIALIAERAGYSSQSAFAQAFKQRWGVSPRDARRQAKHDNIRATNNT
ncbi:AraC family transcriptional regulator [Pseudomonas sp. 5Ae-yellow]|uniref:helix-turn-helix transcriptional regulator n=1 Tax=Pseudomonas sp. 5Ae-yellow TaxID=2759848 RepID=UPI0015F71736|nr:AraC family transcriptional regulator [Pseudomonas sp. 5Ae-yellow]MBA6418317.1 helix-turn-helix transcriptional regulator [Pseudomonas sp. 5Ae-yellow]